MPRKKLANISFKTIKDSLNNLLRSPQHLPILESAVQRSNTLIAHSYQFLKLLLLYHIDKNLEFPEINTKLMYNIYSCIAKKRSNKPLLNEFYQHFYSRLVPTNEIIDYKNLTNILCYSAIDLNSIYANLWNATFNTEIGRNGSKRRIQLVREKYIINNCIALLNCFTLICFLQLQFFRVL